MSPRRTPKTADEPLPRRPFRLRRLLAFGLSAMLCASLFPWHSYDPQDLDRLQGGIAGADMRISNCFGYVGAWTSWHVLLVFGLAAYPMAALLLAASTRRLLSGRGLRPAGWDYWLSLCFFLLGCSMLFGIWPEFLPGATEHLGLIRMPGGALGQRLASSDPQTPGVLRFLLNPMGTAFVATIFIAASLVVLWVHDWHGLLVPLLFRKEEDGKAAATPPNVVSPPRENRPSQDRKPARPTRERRQADLIPEDEPPPPKPAPPPKPEPKASPAEAKATGRRRGKAATSKSDAYVLPPLDLLEADEGAQTMIDPKEVQRKTEILQETLENFGIDAQVVKTTSGPRVTLFEVLPAPGVRVERISNISNNIAMELRALSLRILTPIPGRNTVGIEVPNANAALVTMRNLCESSTWTSPKSAIPVLVGRGIAGDVVVLDLGKAPHLLIAGATGSGKSVCINLLIMSLLYRFTPDELRLILVDPKVVEFACYESLPHLITPVISDVKQVPLALRWVIREMKHRYEIMAKVNARNIGVFNRRPKSAETVYDDDGNPIPERLPYIVVVIDELADIMMTAKADVETSLARIAQLSRAVGIHTILATQRPSVNIITGVIKANFPTRIAFKVTSQVDSRTILDGKGAEALLGQGDMLFRPPGAGTMERNQGGLVRDEEIERVVSFCAEQAEQQFDEDVLKGAEGEEGVVGTGDGMAGGGDLSDSDEALVQQAIDVIRRDRRATTSYVQRALRIGYNRAAMVMDILEERGVIGPQIGQLPRDILIGGGGGEENGDEGEGPDDAIDEPPAST